MITENLKKIINIILLSRGRKQIKIVKEDSNLRNDFGFDSLDLAELTVRIEAEYDIDVFEDGLVETVGEIVRKIEKLK